MIKAIHHVQISIPVGAEDKAREFYCGLLGFNEIPKPEALIARGGLWLELGDLQIHFGAEDGVERTKTKGHVAYLVTGLDEWREKMIAYGCETIDGIAIPNINRFEFRDPFGNRVEFVEKQY